ncbi:MAG: pyridoxal phosphate-dependent aminotransferase [Fimbriimonadales bacterium]|nr:pyridoxal phosphate-dependent aminotransferase [Fimbriimonadales bacterium]
MPKVSDRAVAMPASPIRRLVPFAEAAQQRGVRIHHLNIGQPDIESPDRFWQAIVAAKPKVVAYSHSAGNPSLRAKAAAFYQANGIDVSPDQLLVTTAGSEAIRFALLSCLDPGDEVILPEPLYANYLGFAVEAGIAVRPIATRIEDDFALPEAEAFEAAIGPRTKAILICNPNNPTGAVFPADQLERLRDLALRHDLFLIADEVYREFNYTGRPIRSVLQLEGLERHAILVDSVSKRFSLCGARIGFLATRNEEVLASALKLAQARLSPPTIEQIGVEGALDTEEAYFERVRAEYRERRDLLVRRLRAMPGVLCPRIDGAFYAMVRLPIRSADDFCRWLLESFEHRGQTVMLAPGPGFYATPGLGGDEVRIAYVLNQQSLDAAMDCLEAALSQYPERLR